MKIEPLYGCWKLEKEPYVYTGSREGSERPFGIAATSERFSRGKVSMSVKLSKPDGQDQPSAGIVFGFQHDQARYWILELGGHDSKCCLTEFLPNLGWIAQVRSGSSSTLAYDTSYSLSLGLEGQEVEGVLNGVPLVRTRLGASPVGGLLAIHAYGHSEVEFKDLRIDHAKPRAFVAMPFADELVAEYMSIKLAENGSGFEIFRNDESMHPGIVTSEIRESIDRASALIGVLTWTKDDKGVIRPNENVHYEIGYAHALQKPTILVAEKGTFLPFDLKVDKVIFYERTTAGLNLLSRAVMESLQVLIHAGS